MADLTSFLSGLNGGILGSIGRGMANQRAYEALSQENGPDQAAILMNNPGAFGLGFQRNLFVNQLQSLMGPDPNNPRMSLNEALYRLSPEAQRQQYGVTPVPGFKTPSGAEAPGTITGGQLTPPAGMGFLGPSVGPQSQPTQQPAATRPQPQGPAPLSPMDQAGVNYKGAVSEAEAKGKAAGGLQPGFPQALVKAHQTISALEAIRDDPRLESISGRIAGGLPARYSSAPDLVNSIDSANNMLLNDTLTSARNISGRAINAGTLKEIRPYDLSADRLGGADSLRADINRAIKTIQDETDAAWVGSNSPAEYKPVWGQQQQQQQTIPPAGQRELGKIYNTPKGPHRWKGNGWEPVGNAASL